MEFPAVRLLLLEVVTLTPGELAVSVELRAPIGLQSGTAKMRVIKTRADSAAADIASTTFSHRRPSNLTQHLLIEI